MRSRASSTFNVNGLSTPPCAPACVPAGFEAALGERKMRFIRRGDDDQFQGVAGEQIFDRADDSRVRVKLRGGITSALQNRRDAQPWYRINHWRMEIAARQTKPNQPDINHFASPCGK